MLPIGRVLRRILKLGEHEHHRQGISSRCHKRLFQVENARRMRRLQRPPRLSRLTCLAQK